MRAKVVESKQAEKDVDRAPTEIQKSYEIWARLIEEHGQAILRKFAGYHDEALKGQWQGFRSSRLNKQWRVIYATEQNGSIHIVHVERVTPHDYRRR